MNAFIDPIFMDDPDPQPVSFECKLCHRKFTELPECEALDQRRKMEKLLRVLKFSNLMVERPGQLSINLLLNDFFFLKMDKPESMPIICDECRNHVIPEC